jgi:hypothetical protein
LERRRECTMPVKNPFKGNPPVPVPKPLKPIQFTKDGTGETIVSVLVALTAAAGDLAAAAAAASMATARAIEATQTLLKPKAKAKRPRK